MPEYTNIDTTQRPILVRPQDASLLSLLFLLVEGTKHSHPSSVLVLICINAAILIS